MENATKEDQLSFLEMFTTSSQAKMKAYFRCGGISSSNAEDLTSETVMMALLKIENHSLQLNQNTIDDFTRYLWGIARNIKRKYFRELSSVKFQSIDNDDLFELEAHEEPSTEMENTMNDFPEKLTQAIQQLPTQQKSVAALALLPNEEGSTLNRTEISFILGMEPKTVTKNLQRAKKKLRESLNAYSSIFQEVYHEK
jgi:RNA polymerase sigma factor (sigma-70 family)